jgi:hypothetical protein
MGSLDDRKVRVVDTADEQYLLAILIERNGNVQFNGRVTDKMWIAQTLRRMADTIIVDADPAARVGERVVGFTAHCPACAANGIDLDADDQGDWRFALHCEIGGQVCRGTGTLYRDKDHLPVKPLDAL